MALPYEIFVGLRYLRAKRRNRTISLNTVVSITGITLGVAALIGTVGIMTGFKEDIQAKILGTTAHIIVQDRMKDGMSDYDPVVKQVATVPGVVAATPFVLKQVLLTTQSGVQGIVIRGIDPQREATVTELAKNLSTGELADLSKPVKVKQPPVDAPNGPAVETEKPGIILGKELAMRLGVFVGDTVNVVSPPAGPISAIGMVPKIRTFALVALFQSGMYEYDSSLAYIDLAEAQKFFNLGHTVTGIEIKVTDVFHADETARSVEQSLGFAYGARDWMQMNRNLFSALKLEKTMMFLIVGADHDRGVLQHRQHPHHDRDGETKGNCDPQGDGRDQQKHSAHFHAERIDHRPVRNSDRHPARLRISVADPDILDLRCVGLLHLADPRPCTSDGCPPCGRLRHSDQLCRHSLPFAPSSQARTGGRTTLRMIMPSLFSTSHSFWSAGVITVTDLTKSFPMGGQTLTVLKGVNLQIQRGELIAIVGASGAGKSTLLHIIGTLDRPTTGTVHFDGQDMFHMSEGEQADFRNRRIGFVFQFHHLLPEFTALENACMPALIQRRNPGRY